MQTFFPLTPNFLQKMNGYSKKTDLSFAYFAGENYQEMAGNIIYHLF